MDGVVIHISWEYFLAVFSTLVGIGYYANGRFTRLETSVDWLTEAVRSFKISAENDTVKLFDVASPVSLTSAGRRALKQSGLKDYIDNHRKDLIARCRGLTNLYDRQTHAFRLFDDLVLEETVAQRLNEFAFANGLSPELLRRVGAIYFRDIASGSA